MSTVALGPTIHLVFRWVIRVNIYNKYTLCLKKVSTFKLFVT